LKLGEINFAVTVRVDLLHDLLPDPVCTLHAFAQDLSDFGRLDRATPVLIKEREGCSHVLFVDQLVLVDRGGAPLCEVDSTAAVHIRLVENCARPFFHSGFVLLRIQLDVGVEEFGLLDLTVAVFIELSERLPELFYLLLRRKVAGHEGECRLLHLALAL